jgi:hypothetical protein
MWGWAVWILALLEKMLEAMQRCLACLSSRIDKVTCRRTWHAPCDSLAEWESLQIPAGTTDRLQIVPAPGGRPGNALRVEVRDNDVAENPYNHQPIPGGWRAEGIGPTESEGMSARYIWSTLLDPSYPADPLRPDGKPIWQVITQWHQGDNDVGSSPPIEFTLYRGKIYFHLNRVNPANENESVPGLEIEVADLARGQWHDFQLDVRWSLTNGSVAVAHDGVEKFRGSGLATLFSRLVPVGSSVSPGTVYLKVGLYREAVPLGVPCVLYHKDVSRCEPN